MKVRSRIVVGIIGAAAVVVTSLTMASASVPDSSDVIHACYTTSSGALRVIDTDNGGNCYGYETAISWPSKAPSLKYFTGTTATDSQRNASVNCPDGGLPIALWINGHSVTSGDSHVVPSEESLNFPSGSDFTGTTPPIGISGYGADTPANSTVNYSLICT